MVTHIGSGVTFEVSSALDTLILLTSKYSGELLPISSHINGILSIPYFSVLMLSLYGRYTLSAIKFSPSSWFRHLRLLRRVS